MPKVPDGWVEAVIDRGVVVVPGEAFGDAGAGYARISYATGIEELKEAIEAMGEATRAVH
jgi:aspartate aminotransferase